MSDTITIPLVLAPTCITQSVLQALVPHGYTIMRTDGTNLSEEEWTKVRGEIGRNAAQALCSLDVSEED